MLTLFKHNDWCGSFQMNWGQWHNDLHTHTPMLKLAYQPNFYKSQEKNFKMILELFT